MSDRDLITLYSDGACENNPGPGGWAVILRSGMRERRLSGGYRKTTNNRMELRAVIEGLKAFKGPGDTWAAGPSQRMRRRRTVSTFRRLYEGLHPTKHL